MPGKYSIGVVVGFLIIGLVVGGCAGYFAGHSTAPALTRTVTSTISIAPKTVTKTAVSSAITTKTVTVTSSVTSTRATTSKKISVTLTAIFAAPKARWDALVKAAIKKFEEEYPNIILHVKYMVYPYGQMHQKLITMAAAKSKADIVSLDQIWLGQFVKAGYIRDITNWAMAWGVTSKLFKPYLAGCEYNGKIYAIWAWTDARLMWYRKDVLQKAGVSPSQLTTWQGFLKAVPKIVKAARAEGMAGVAFPGAPWLVDWWYPFLFENGGTILVKTSSGWKVGFDNEAGIKAVEFLVAMKKTGVSFPTTWRWGEEFASGRYAIWFGGTWVLGKFPKSEWSTIKNKIGVQMFPAPKGKTPRTLSGGWLLAIPSTSEHPKIAWEFIKCMLSPDVLAPVLAKYTYLPTEKYILNNPKYAALFEKIPFWSVFEKALKLGAARPNIPQYPQMAQILYEELSKAVYGQITPAQAIHTAAQKINSLLSGGSG